MIQFEWFLVLLVLPLPIVVRRLIPKREAKSLSLRVPFFAEVSDPGFAVNAASRSSISIAVLLWLAFVFAAARPIWVEETVDIPITGRDLLLALDISGSMQQQDFSVGNESRFDAVQKIASQFVERRAGDRVGLILFGSQPYLYAPLTFDRNTVVEFLSHAKVGFAGQQTAIGDTIGLAVKVLRERSAENRILILLTDGDNSAGTIDPLDGMQLAVENGVRIFVIGIGIDHSAANSRSSSRRPANVLPQIAETTGGVYFYAANARALQGIYAAIDEFEPIVVDSNVRLLVTELYPWPLAFAMALTALLFFQPAMARLIGTRHYTRRTDNADSI